MEKALEDRMVKAMQNTNTNGIVCADMQGLCLGHRGVATEALAGPIAALCDEAYKQWPSQDSPVIVLETSGNTNYADINLLIKMNDGICTGVIKPANN